MGQEVLLGIQADMFGARRGSSVEVETANLDSFLVEHYPKRYLEINLNIAEMSCGHFSMLVLIAQQHFHFLSVQLSTQISS